ncbi:hypothetical protein VB005_01643 [Metarhizium brunneum]
MSRKLLTLLSVAAIANAVGNLTSNGCADAPGFQSCQDAANEKINACFSKTKGDGVAQQACACEDYILNYNCYAAHCWNRVWECEYQEYLVSYLMDCPIAKLPVPYFPIPDNAAGACSCNVGKVYKAITDSITQGASCMKNVHGADTIPRGDKIGACGCCEISGAMSSILEICPDTKPDLVGLASVSKIQTQLDIDFCECQPMTKINCASDLNFSLAGVSTYFPPSSLPTSGTATLSNNPGSVTAPPSGSVFSYTNGGDKVVYTITAASASNGKGSESGASGSATATTASKRGAAASVMVPKGLSMAITGISLMAGVMERWSLFA